MIGISGIIGIGRTHWRCEHRTERGYHFEVNETEKICFCNRIPARLRTMLYMSGMSYIHLYLAGKKRREKRITGLCFFPPIFCFLFLLMSRLLLSVVPHLTTFKLQLCLPLLKMLPWQEEYAVGDDLGALDCGHDFHTNCIKQWLMQKNLCPICKTTALLT
jgi:hypothetical protein